MPDSECNAMILSESAADFIIEYGGDAVSVAERYDAECFQVINSRYLVIHTPVARMNEITRFAYNSVPKLYGLMDTTSMDVSGITRLHRQPYLSLRGSGILVGVIDTGIDYTHQVFRYANGTTRIVRLWDQSIQGGPMPENTSYGTEYTQEMINEALASANPYDIVPSEDTQGHGTVMAGIAAGGYDAANDFTGAAPEASIAVVKLKPAKNYLRSYYLVKDEAPAFQENDIMMGLRYLLETARALGKPLVVVLGVGTSSGDHNGLSYLNSYMNDIGDLRGCCMVSACGNEGNEGGHYLGRIEPGEMYEDVEIRVDSSENGFITELWGRTPDIFSVGILTPAGERIEQIPPRYGQVQTIDFVLEPTQVYIQYKLVESSSGDSLISMRFQNPTPGVWTIRVFGENLVYRTYNMWLPISGFLTEGTYFLKPEPDTTVTSPGDTNTCVNVAAYNHNNDSIYYASGRGFTPSGRIVPDIAAPGVNVYAPIVGGRFGLRSGTSVAAAHAAGAAALLMEWGIYRQNNLNMDTTEIKKYLIRGAKRREDIVYPNTLWGFGTLDLYNVFQSLTT